MTKHSAGTEIRAFTVVLFLAVSIGAACTSEPVQSIPESEPAEPELSFAAITGTWLGSCCGYLDHGLSWYLDLNEDSSGAVTGTVRKTVVNGPSVGPPPTYSGIVKGVRQAPDVVLHFTYDGGAQERYRGRQYSETTIGGYVRGAVGSGWSAPLGRTSGQDRSTDR